MERRTFLELSGSTILGAMISPSVSDLILPKTKKNIGLQLYTVRDNMSKDPIATLKSIAGIGYKHVESAGYYNRQFYGQTKENFKIILDDFGLKMYSGHTATGIGMGKDSYNMSNNWEAVCEDAAFMGQKYIVCGWFSPNERKTVDDYTRIAQLFNICGEKAKEYGLQFCHHNHDFEFFPMDTTVPYDILLNETDKNLVKFELDHYWTKKANVDSIQLMNQHVGRFPLWHIKDMANTSENSFTEVGSGIINYKSIFASKAKKHMDLYFVEQDSNHKGSPMQSIEISFKNLDKIKI